MGLLAYRLLLTEEWFEWWSGYVIKWKDAGKLLINPNPYLRWLTVKTEAKPLVITGEGFAVADDTFNTMRLSQCLQANLWNHSEMWKPVEWANTTGD